MDNCCELHHHHHHHHDHDHHIAWNIDYKSSDYNGMIPIIRNGDDTSIPLYLNNTAGAKGDKAFNPSNRFIFTKKNIGSDAAFDDNKNEFSFDEVFMNPVVGDVLVKRAIRETGSVEFNGLASSSTKLDFSFFPIIDVDANARTFKIDSDNFSISSITFAGIPYIDADTISLRIGNLSDSIDNLMEKVNALDDYKQTLELLNEREGGFITLMHNIMYELNDVAHISYSNNPDEPNASTSGNVFFKIQ